MDKLRLRQELQAYRIVRRNVLKIVNSIPFNNMTIGTYTALVNANVTESQIKKMYKRNLYYFSKPQYKRTEKTIKN